VTGTEISVFGNRLTAGQQSLNLFIKVRILVPELLSFLQ
jgi:hypothetical protein